MMPGLLLAGLLWAQVHTGLDRLAEEGFAPLRGKTIAVLTHAAAVDRNGTPITEVLSMGAGFRIGAWFSPEHGFASKLDQETIPDRKEEHSGAIIYSLYGKTRRPTPAMLKGIDLLVCDLQDVGTRFYTYATTLLFAMEACAEAGVPVLVLDRPNPIGGTRCTGPMLDPDRLSFVGHFPMPLVHGMTLGELALMFRGEEGLQLQLQVQKMSGWRRNMLFEDTGLPWVNPSPNMRTPNQALLYPAVGMLEATNLSVGRGTDTPFERLGAPWIESTVFSAELNSLDLAGIQVVPVSFTPESGPYAGKRCGGIHILLRDPRAFDPMDLGYHLFRTLRRDYAESYDASGLLRLLGNREMFTLLLGDLPLAKVRRKERRNLRAFLTVRKRYLQY